jgi:hypothetical protein
MNRKVRVLPLETKDLGEGRTTEAIKTTPSRRGTTSYDIIVVDKMDSLYQLT